MWEKFWDILVPWDLPGVPWARIWIGCRCKIFPTAVSDHVGPKWLPYTSGISNTWQKSKIGSVTVCQSIDHCSSGRPSAANFWFLTAIEVHCFYSWLGKKFDLGLFSCKTWVPNRSFKIGFINLSQIFCLWQWFEIELDQKSQNSDLQFSWNLEFCKKHPIFKMPQIPKYPTNFQI